MQVFITGTDTNIGKTITASWLCLHLGYDYFKPIQSGNIDDTDSQLVAKVSGCRVHKETYLYKPRVSPHLAAQLVNETIDIEKIKLPVAKNLIIEGAGGVLVPLNLTKLVIDLITQFNTPTILVASSRLGTINHTLLSLEALRTRNINVLGVIMSGELNHDNYKAIENYGNIKVLAQIPFISQINNQVLKSFPLSEDLNRIFLK